MWHRPIKHVITAISVPMGALLCCSVSYAAQGDAVATASPVSGKACTGIVSNADRLACYDQYYNVLAQKQVAQATEQKTEIAATEAAQVKAAPDSITGKLKRSLNFIYSTDVNKKLSPLDSMLDSRWELSEQSKLGTWNIRGYKPVYVLPAFWTSNKNSTPYSPNPDNVVPYQNLNSTELKFQLSLKTKALENIFGNNGDLWVGYTQASHWQAYNSAESSPFRESSYEPEASLMFRTNYQLLGLNGRLLGVTINHQSNGQSDPFSRSWNRVMLNIGLERDNFAVILRPWYRIPESASDDNNPDIKNYIGRGDLTAFYKYKEHNFSLMLRHTLKGGDNSRGAMQFDWTFPIKGNLRGQLQYFNGYGESLIDYNHRANYIGIGVSLLDWY